MSPNRTGMIVAGGRTSTLTATNAVYAAEHS
jgi:hypothetical protein